MAAGGSFDSPLTGLVLCRCDVVCITISEELRFVRVFSPCLSALLRSHHLDRDAAGGRETSGVSNRHLERITARTSESGRRVLGLVRPVCDEGYIRWP